MEEIHRKASASFDANGSSDGEGSESAERKKNIIIERIVKYCTAKKEGVDMSGDAKGLKIQGAGQGNFWVYTREELDYLATIDCEKFLARVAELSL